MLLFFLLLLLLLLFLLLITCMKIIMFSSTLGSFSTASCTNCGYKVSSDVIKQDIFNQVGCLPCI